MTPVRAPTLKKPSTWHQFTRLLNKWYIHCVQNHWPELVQIVFACFSYAPYSGLPSINNIFMCASFFLVCFFVSFSSHTFSWACGSLHEPQKFFSFCAFMITCLSNNSTHFVTDLISAKLVSALLPCMLYLSYYFQPEVNTWMYLRKAITLEADNCHNLDPRQMICISFQIHNLYWCITL